MFRSSRSRVPDFRLRGWMIQASHRSLGCKVWALVGGCRSRV